MHTRHLRTRNHPARAVTEKYKTDYIPLMPLRVHTAFFGPCPIIPTERERTSRVRCPATYVRASDRETYIAVCTCFICLSRRFNHKDTAKEVNSINGTT